jgi:hypothetical protein
MGRINFNLDPETHKAFRVRLAEKEENAADVLREAIRKYCEEGNEMKYTFNEGTQAHTVSGIIVVIPDQLDIWEDYDNPKSYPAKHLDGTKCQVRVDHELTGTNTPGTGDTVVRIV